MSAHPEHPSQFREPGCCRCGRFLVLERGATFCTLCDSPEHPAPGPHDTPTWAAS